MNLNTLTIIQHNVRSWNNNKIALSNIYNQYNPDIILINSHSLLQHEHLKIFNYNVFQCNKENEPHAGTAIAIKKNISFKLHDTFITDILAITINTQQGPITIATSYIPPRRNYLNIIDYHSLFTINNPVYLISDLNAYHYAIGHTHSNRRGENLYHLISRQVCTHIGPFFSTFITHRSTTSPDIILQNNLAFHNTHFQPGPLTPSDHIPIIATISVNPIQIPIKTRPHYHRADWDSFKDILSTTDVPDDPLPTLEDIDNYLDDWTTKIKTASQITIPNITHRIIPGIKPNNDTLTLQNEYLTLMNDIQQHGPTLLKNRELNRLRQTLNHTYRLLHNDCWNGIINLMQIDRNPKQFWKSIRKLSGNSSRQTAPYLFDGQNRRINSNADRERLFRDHWEKIYDGRDDEDNDFDDDNIDTVIGNVVNNYENTVPYDTGDLNRLNPTDFPPMTLADLKDYIKRTKQRAPGPTGITSLHLKHLPVNMLNYLLYIFNHSLSAGYFPDKLKIATVVFIPKGNKSPYYVTNYRPISLLDIHGKILDRLLKDRLYSKLETDNLINDRQHGFRQFRGTNTAIAIFHQQIALHAAHRRQIDVTLRDVTKAFDRVWHTGLKHKLLRLQLHPSFTRILSDFITDRLAQIRIGTHIGPPFPLQSGVPQGAVLSPTLYSYYTHDLPQPLPDTDYIAYADDITQLIATPGNIANNTIHAIEQINHFENQWKIQTNMTKFKIINLCRRKTDDIFIDDRHIPYADTGTILGLKFSRTGYKTHITARCAQARTQLNKIRRFTNLSPDNKKKLYLTLVRSTLLYPPIPLHTLAKTPMLRLQAIQNNGLRFVYNTSWTDFITNQELHTRASIPPVNVYLHNLAKKTWNTIEQIMPQQFNSLTFPADLNEHSYFKDSKSRALGPEPLPLYTQ